MLNRKHRKESNLVWRLNIKIWPLCKQGKRLISIPARSCSSMYQLISGPATIFFGVDWKHRQRIELNLEIKATLDCLLILASYCANREPGGPRTSVHRNLFHFLFCLLLCWIGVYFVSRFQLDTNQSWSEYVWTKY